MTQNEKKEAFFKKESGHPIPAYPFPKIFDKKLEKGQRLVFLKNFSEWEKKFLTRIECMINLAEKIIISEKNYGIIVFCTINGFVFVNQYLLEEITKKSAKKEFSKAEATVIWQAVEKELKNKKEQLHKYVQG